MGINYSLTQDQFSYKKQNKAKSNDISDDFSQFNQSNIRLIQVLNSPPINTMQIPQPPIQDHNSPPIQGVQILQPPIQGVRMLHPPIQVHDSLQYKSINIPQENNEESNKRKRFDINETVVYKYYFKHGIKPTKRKYHVGFQRLQKIIKNQGNKYVSSIP